MVLVVVEIHLVFHGPASIKVFLAKLVALLFPGLRNLERFDPPVFLTVVALPGNINETGINNLTGVGKDALIVKRLIEAGKQGLNELFPNQGFAKIPDGLGIGNLVIRPQSKEALEAKPFGNLELHHIVRKAVKD